MWGWETLLIPIPGFCYFQGLLAQRSSFWLTAYWTLHKSSTGFLAEHFQLPKSEWRQLGSVLLILQLQPSPDYQFQCFPWVQFNYKNIFTGSQQSTLSPGGSSELHTNRNCKLLDFYLDPLIMLLALDTWETHLSPSNTTWRKKHSSATGSFTNYAKT